jgi:hypothetical protein
MPWFAEPNVVARDAEVLALRKRVRVLVLGGCWPLPYMRRHAVKDLHRISTCRCHRRFVTLLKPSAYWRTAATGSFDTASLLSLCS